MDRGAWQAIIHEVAESDMTQVPYHGMFMSTKLSHLMGLVPL